MPRLQAVVQPLTPQNQQKWLNPQSHLQDNHINADFSEPWFRIELESRQLQGRTSYCL